MFWGFRETISGLWLHFWAFPAIWSVILWEVKIRKNRKNRDLGPKFDFRHITQYAKQGGGSGKDLVILDPIFSKNKRLRARKRSPDALNIFPDTYDLSLHPPKRLRRYATIFTDWCNGLVAKCHVDISKWPPQKHPFWRYLIQKIEPASCLSR